jgi:hypothetical protein
MSLSSTLSKTIDATIQEFISEIVSKYNLDKNEIQLLWTKGDNKITKPNTPEKVVIDKKTTVNKDSNISELSKLNKNELISMCKTHGHKCSGTKDALINRILGKEDGEEKKSQVQVTNTVKSTKKVDEKLKETPVIKKVISNIPNVLIRRNKFNNYEHPESGFIFDNDTKTIIGKQKNDGSIEDLSSEDIEKCKYLYNFKYKLPSNLDAKSSLADVKIDELSEDDLEVEEYEDEESKIEEELVEEDLLEEDLDEEDLLEEEEELVEEDD